MYAAERRSMTRVPKAKRIHLLVERLDADHRERIVFVLSGEPTTQKRFKQRLWIITRLRQLGYYKKKWSR